MYSVRWDRFKYRSEQFGIWRAAFGFYLFFFFARVFPYLKELYSHEGPFRNLSTISHDSFYPQFLLTFDSLSTVQAMTVGCMIFSLAIMLGFYRKTAALFLWMLATWFYARNSATNSPELGFVNWLIFACIFIPSGEKFSLGPKDPDWKMPKLFYWGAWVVLGVGYFYAGGSKFRSHDPSWMDGSAMYYVLVYDNARFAWYGSLFEHIPKVFFKPITYSALLLQTLAPVFIYFRSVRPWWWLVSTLVHVSLLLFVNLGQLTLGMVFFHLFLIDYRWIEFLRERYHSLAHKKYRV